MFKLVATALLAATALGSCTVSDGTSTFDLSAVPVARGLAVKQVSAANPHLNGVFAWTISLCSPAYPTRDQSCNQDSPVYAAEYPIGGNACEESMATALAPWSWDAAKGGATRTFSGVNKATVTVKCDRSASSLVVDGNATLVMDGRWVWGITLRSSAVCPSGPAPPAPTPSGGFRCGASAPARAQVPRRASLSMAVASVAGRQLSCLCLTAASNTTGASAVQLFVACAPTTPQAAPVIVEALSKNGGFTAAAPLTARCPGLGFFSLIAQNLNELPAVVELDSQCAVDGQPIRFH